MPQKPCLQDDYPKDAFSVRIMPSKISTMPSKIAEETGVDARAGKLVRDYFTQAIDAGLGDQYHPVVKRLVEKG